MASIKTSTRRPYDARLVYSDWRNILDIQPPVARLWLCHALHGLGRVFVLAGIEPTQNCVPEGKCRRVSTLVVWFGIVGALMVGLSFANLYLSTMRLPEMLSDTELSQAVYAR